MRLLTTFVGLRKVAVATLTDVGWTTRQSDVSTSPAYQTSSAQLPRTTFIHTAIQYDTFLSAMNTQKYPCTRPNAV